MTIALQIATAWLCISIIFGAAFGFIATHSRKRYQHARRSLVQRERRVEHRGQVRL